MNIQELAQLVQKMSRGEKSIEDMFNLLPQAIEIIKQADNDYYNHPIIVLLIGSINYRIYKKPVHETIKSVDRLC